MNGRKAALLIIAMIIAGGTAFIARSMLSTSAPTVTASGDTKSAPPVVTQILVASRDLPAGTLLKDTDLKWQPWPADQATEIYAVKGKVETSAYVGSVVRQGLRVNEPLVAGRVVRTNEQGFLAAVLSPGMRAITVPVTPASSIAGLIFPGDRVDVIVAHKIVRKSSDGNTSSEHRVSETMLTNVRVLALDQRTNDQAKDVKDAGKPPQLATLEVTPHEAEQIALVAEMGTMSLVLRSLAIDLPLADPSDKAGFTWDSDISRVMPEPVNRNGQVHRVQIMRGKEMTETLFDAP